MKPHYQLTLALTEEQLNPFGEAVGFACIGYPKVVRAALDGLMQALQEQNPALLPGFKQWADDLYAYTTRAAATGDMIAFRIGQAEPVWIDDAVQRQPGAPSTEGPQNQNREADKAAWEGLMKQFGIKPKGGKA